MTNSSEDVAIKNLNAQVYHGHRMLTYVQLDKFCVQGVDFDIACQSSESLSDAKYIFLKLLLTEYDARRTADMPKADAGFAETWRDLHFGRLPVRFKGRS